jgi:aspartyl/glutamyl-tRNA(Asn/Gln) amidotransferase, C subunit
MALTENDVARIARLARLDMTPQRLEQARAELNGIMDLIARLQAVDTKGVEPLAHPLSAHDDVVLRLREDVVTETGDPAQRREALMANAPAASNGLFLVPKVIE